MPTKYLDLTGLERLKNYVSGPDTSEILNRVYPVGSIYMSMTNTNPSTLFGGTWESVEGKFLLGADTTYTAGSTGGNSSVTLTTSELPSHNHSLNSHTHTYSKSSTTSGSHTLTVSEMPSHTHNNMMNTIKSVDSSYGFTKSSPGYTDRAIARTTTEGNSLSTGSSSVTNIKSTGGGGGHTHSITLTSTDTGTATGNTGSKGSGSSFSIMNPYLAVYIWKRTA